MTGRIADSIPFRALDGMARILLARAWSCFSSPVRSTRPEATRGEPGTVTMLVADDRIDRRVLMQARSLAKAGIRTTVIALPSPGPADADAAAFPDIDILRIDPSEPAAYAEGEDRTRLGLLAGLGAAFFLHHRAFLQAALSRPADIVVAHDLPVFATGAIAADLTGARLFFDAHELYPEQRQLKAWRRRIYRMAERRLLPLADTVTTVNPSIARELASRGAKAEPTVILNVPDVAAEADFSAKRHCFHELFDLPDSARVMLFHGSLSPNRNLVKLIEAMEQVDEDCVLVVMGPDGGCLEELRAAARRNGLLETRIHFHEAVAQARLLAMVACADIGIVPYPAIDLNTKFCTPNKLFDFIVCGVPVLANDLPELRRIVDGNSIGIVAVMSDAAEIAASVNRMMASDLAAMRKRALGLSPQMRWPQQEPVLLSLYGVEP